MTQNLTDLDWKGGRAERWQAQLADMEAMLVPIDGPLIEALDLQAPCRIADVGCGGGGTSIQLARRAPTGSTVDGFDISPTMIETARARASSAGIAITFTLGDAELERAPEILYDRLVSRLGVMFFKDPHAAFSNLLTWLVQGGRFAFATWGCPQHNPWMTTVRDVVSDVHVPPPDPDGPGPFRYATSEKLLELLGDVGFEQLDVQSWRGTLPVGNRRSASEAARFGLTSFSSFSDLLAAAGEEVFEAAHRALTARLAHHERNNSVEMDASVLIYTGQRPSMSENGAGSYAD